MQIVCQTLIKIIAKIHDENVVKDIIEFNPTIDYIVNNENKSKEDSNKC